MGYILKMDMPFLTKLIPRLEKVLWVHLVFWLLIFLLNVGPQWSQYASIRELLETAGSITFLQMFVAYTSLWLLIPKVLNKGHRVTFVLLFLLLLVFASEAFISFRYFYLETAYPASHAGFLKAFGHQNYWQRLANYKFVVFVKMPLFALTACILAAFDFYKKQQRLLVLSEQKRTAELKALKNQLNPHFLFNTLNNLYALTLKKSDQAPVVIEKLSAILDYMLYRCNDPFTSLKKEISLIQDYLDIEKIRYGKRLSISLETHVEQDAPIAPLILLNLVENACKHSAGQELKQAHLTVFIAHQNQTITVRVDNTKPTMNHTHPQRPTSPGIGLNNLKMQLELLYPQTHHLQIQDQKDRFLVELKVQTT